MLSEAFQPGKRTFAVASIATIIIAILHTTALRNVPNDSEWSVALDAMKAAAIMPGESGPSLFDLTLGLWIQVGALLFVLGTGNFIVLTTVHSSDGHRVIRSLSLFNTLVYSGLVALFIWLRILPPLVSYAVLAVLFAIITLRTWKSRDT